MKCLYPYILPFHKLWSSGRGSPLSLHPGTISPFHLSLGEKGPIGTLLSRSRVSAAVDQRIETRCSHAQALPAETLKVTLVFLIMKYRSTISKKDHKLQRNSRNLLNSWIIIIFYFFWLRVQWFPVLNWDWEKARAGREKSSKILLEWNYHFKHQRAFREDIKVLLVGQTSTLCDGDKMFVATRFLQRNDPEWPRSTH